MTDLYIINGGSDEAWRLVHKITGVGQTCVRRNEHGKPYIENGRCFNISHSEGKAVVCFSDGEVGVDIERIRPCNIKIAERFFTQEESRRIKTDYDFLKIWTAKESYIKCVGTGFATPLHSFDVDTVDAYFFHDDIDGYHICVCTKQKSEVHFR